MRHVKDQALRQRRRHARNSGYSPVRLAGNFKGLAIKKIASTWPDFIQKLGVLVQQLEQIHDRCQGPRFSALVA